MRESHGLFRSSLPPVRSRHAGGRAPGVHLPRRTNLPVRHLLERIQVRPIQTGAELCGRIPPPAGCLVRRACSPLRHYPGVAGGARDPGAPHRDLPFPREEGHGREPAQPVRLDPSAGPPDRGEPQQRGLDQRDRPVHQQAIWIGGCTFQRGESLQEVARLRPLHDPASGQWEEAPRLRSRIWPRRKSEQSLAPDRLSPGQTGIAGRFRNLFQAAEAVSGEQRGGD